MTSSGDLQDGRAYQPDRKQARDAWRRGFLAGLTPDPDLDVTEWADRFRFLTSATSSEPGRYRSERTPYVREIGAELSASSKSWKVVFVAGVQVGKSTVGLNWLGYIIHKAPGPVMVVQPIENEARKFSQERLDELVDNSPALVGRVTESKKGEKGNTTLRKEFRGGSLVLTGANSAAGLRSKPVRYLFLDEVDQYVEDVDGQGPPIKLAEARTPTFGRKRKIFICSTPTIEHVSPIEKEWNASDQRRYFVACPYCNNRDWIRWENIRFDEGRPETARLVCIACSREIPEGMKPALLAGGEWRPTRNVARDGPARPGVAGFHLSALYSPLGWLSWSSCVEQFLEAKDDPVQLKLWVNTVLGETWKDRNESVEVEDLVGRLERYEAEVPHGVGILTASVDVQGDRLEIIVKGYGVAEESWLVAYHAIHGDPGRDHVWQELDVYLGQRFKHASGRLVGISCVAVDSGGHHSDQVYRFCRARLARKVFAIKGGTLRGLPLVGRPSSRNRYRAKLFTLCVDTGKAAVLGRLRIAAVGPGYCHLPEFVDLEYLEQLTAERAIPKRTKGGVTVREWVKTRPRNEALDLEVYALAALYILGPPVIRTLPERAAALSAPLEEAENRGGSTGGGTAPASPAKPPRRRGWVNRW